MEPWYGLVWQGRNRNMRGMKPMPRPLVLGNGTVLACLDDQLVLRDLYYPHVGQLNHIKGRRNQLGIWTGGEYTWLGDPGWRRRPGYKPGTLVARSTAVHPGLGLRLAVEETVHHRHNVYLRRVTFQNGREEHRELRCFVAADFDLDETDVGDTALWDPALGVIYHYKRNRCFLIGGLGPRGGIDQYACGRKRFQDHEGTWRDAEDGRLEGNPISQGAVDSAVGWTVPLPPGGQAELTYWVALGTDFAEVRRIHLRLLEHGPGELLDQAESFWRSWAAGGAARVAGLPADLVAAYRLSLLVVRTHCDTQGGIVAANDSDLLEFNRDHYSYVWPRDGALVAAAMDRAGYPALTRRFYDFCRRTLTEGGYLWHKYNPDGTIGSSWHAWIGARGPQLPIQEDETALVLWALGRHYELHRDMEAVEGLYRYLVRPAANFLAEYRDDATGLPLESHDLWEERRGVWTWTAATVVAGLRAAAHLAALLGDRRGARRWQQAAGQTRAALLRYLWSEGHRRFLRGGCLNGRGELIPDETLESSAASVFLFGVLPPDDPRVAATMAAIEAGLWCQAGVGGVARYQGDGYFRPGPEAEGVPGNPWLICTLWCARYHAARARTPAELDRALALIRWCLRHALPTGVLPEQVHPRTGRPLSVAPLTWSHATLVDAILDYAAARRRLGVAPGPDLERRR